MKIFIIYSLIILILSSFIIGCTTKPSEESPARAFLIPIFESNMSIYSFDGIKLIFKENSEEILGNLKACNSILDSGFFNYTNYWNANELLYSYLDIEKKERFGDYYIVTIPIVPKEFNWEYNNKIISIVYTSCKDSSETRMIENGELSPCKSGTVVRKKIAQDITFFVTPDGIIFYDFKNPIECNVTNLPSDSFKYYIKNPYINVWTEVSEDLNLIPSKAAFTTPSECFDEDFLKYMEENSDLIADAKVESIEKYESGYQGGLRQHAYLKIQNLIKGDPTKDTIILMTRLEIDENPNLSKNKIYRIYITTHPDSFRYWLICGTKSIQEKS